MDRCDKGGRTPLLMAAEQGNSRCIQMLLNAGARVNGSSVGGETASWCAAIGDHPVCLAMLMRSGANLEAADTNGRSTWAVATGMCRKLLCQEDKRRQMGWRSFHHEWYSPEERACVRAALLQAVHGRALRFRPDDDPEDWFEHAMPPICTFDTLNIIGRGWMDNLSSAN